MTEWYYARGGQQSGPVTFVQLGELARSGALDPVGDFVWTATMTGWTPAGQVPGLFNGVVHVNEAPAAPVADPSNPYAATQGAWIEPVSSETALRQIIPGSEPIDQQKPFTQNKQQHYKGTNKLNENNPQQPQFVNTQRPESGTVTALAVVSIIFGTIGLLGSFIPCLGALAISVAVPAALCGAGATYMAKSKGCSIGLPVAAFVVSAIGVIISSVQIFALNSATKTLDEEMKRDMKARQEQLQKPNNER